MGHPDNVTTHPEAHDCEVFLGNFDQDCGFVKTVSSKIASVRMGENAYYPHDIGGEPIPHLHPVFVAKCDLDAYNKLEFEIWNRDPSEQIAS